MVGEERGGEGRRSSIASSMKRRTDVALFPLIESTGPWRAHDPLLLYPRGFGTLTSSHRAVASTSVFLSFSCTGRRIQDASDTCKGCRILLKRHVRYFGEEDVLREKYVIGHTRPLFFQRYFPSSRFENHYFLLNFF